MTLTFVIEIEPMRTLHNTPLKDYNKTGRSATLWLSCSDFLMHITVPYRSAQPGDVALPHCQLISYASASAGPSAVDSTGWHHCHCSNCSSKSRVPDQIQLVGQSNDPQSASQAGQGEGSAAIVALGSCSMEQWNQVQGASSSIRLVIRSCIHS